MNDQTVNIAAPTDAPHDDRQIVAPPKSWHRLVLSLFGISIIVSIWTWAVHFIFQLPSEKLAAFTSVTTNSFYTIAAIIIFMITGRLVFEWQNATTAASSVVSEAKTLLEKKDITVTKQPTRSDFYNDQ